MHNKITDRIVFLDYTRILAFVSVLIGHQFIPPLMRAMSDTSLHDSLRILASIAYEICYGGAAGVVIFFLTSGYIIAHVLQTEKTNEFVIKRIFRIYPLFMFAVLLQAIMDRYIDGIPFVSFSDWIPRLLLLGDYFGVRPAIGSVEWTLRIEITFYVFMAVLKVLGLINHQKYLPVTFILATAALHYLPPFPNSPGLAYAYFSIYAPFLFAGTCFYLIEHRKARVSLCVAAIAVIVYSFFFKITIYAPTWSKYHYGLYAVGIFGAAWIFRRSMIDGPIIRTLSTLTYSVYLFHNWLWQYIERALSSLEIQGPALKTATLVLLFAFCYAANKTVEDYGLGLGKKVISRLRNRNKHRIAEPETA